MPGGRVGPSVFTRVLASRGGRHESQRTRRSIEAEVRVSRAISQGMQTTSTSGEDKKLGPLRVSWKKDSPPPLTGPSKLYE